MSIIKTNRIHSFFVLTVIFFLALIVPATARETRFESAGLQLDIPQPQGFCGYCHILTYPDIINKSHETWQKDKHNKVGCIECHYKPKAPGTRVPMTAPKLSTDHIPKVPPGHFSYVELGGETMKTVPQISDAGCMTSSCHGKPDDPFRTKKIKFTEKIPFVHEPHLAKKNQIEGMQVNCTTCHQHETEMKHFQVTEATCHLCHFANTKFNQGRAKCELCHQLPTKSIQSSQDPDVKPITHQMLKKAGVSCSSCHFDLIKGAGEKKVELSFEGGKIKTVMILGLGQLKKENCLRCHDQDSYFKKAGDKKEMHKAHVNIKNARCFDCHRPIQHSRAEKNHPMPGDCGACHSEPHRYQRLLSAGLERDGISAIPDPMFKARTKCLGCHLEKEINHRGQTIMRASARACVQCHSKDYEQMFGLWKSELAREIKKAQKLESEALEALAKHKTKVSEEKLKEAGQMLKSGREDLGIVRFGNGIHNAKYAMALLDAAITSFKDTIGYLEGKDMSEDMIQGE